MSGTSTVVLATGAFLVAGRIAADKKISVQMVVGGAAVALGIALMDSYNAKFANQFATLLLVVALLDSVPSLYKALRKR